MSLPTTLLLDTNVISMLMRDPHGHVTEGLNRARALAPDLRVVTSVVVDGELRFGLERRGSAKLQGAYANVMQIIEVLPLPPEAAQPYATLRGHLESRGQPIGPNDALIAAHALALGGPDAAASAVPLPVAWDSVRASVDALSQVGALRGMAHGTGCSGRQGRLLGGAASCRPAVQAAPSRRADIVPLLLRSPRARLADSRHPCGRPPLPSPAMQCLLNSTVGLGCPLAQAVMTPVRGGRLSHHIGILRTLTAG